MRQVNIYEAKTQLSKLLRRVREGGEVIIADAGLPIARLVPYATPSTRRVLGQDVGKLWMAEDFDAPLPDATIRSFLGGMPTSLPSLTGAGRRNGAATSARTGRTRKPKE